MAAAGLAQPLQPLVDEAIAALSASFAFWSSLPWTYVFIGHCLYCSLAAPDFRNRPVVHYLLTFLWGNGGGTFSALILMAPQHAKLSFFSSNEVLATWTACWWLVNFAPGGLPRSLVSKHWIKMVCKSCTAWCRAMLIIQRVDLGASLYPGIVAAPLLLGTLAGCGGRLFADAILGSWGALPGNAELTSPGFVSRSAVLAALLYYGLCHATQLLPRSAAAGLVVSVLILHAFASELQGAPLDFTAPVSRLFHAVTRVPEPPPQLSAEGDAARGKISAQAASPAGKTTPRNGRLAAEQAGGAAAAAASAGGSGSPAKPHTPGGKRAHAATAAAARSGVVDASVGAGAAEGGSLAAGRPRRTTRRPAAYAS